ncbi:hypothetical protein SteCoe_19524 [Stentor coeruleus]|uniref:Uncharacterized protein n=1 Tax=Stentor coeruleus TaxID=5963 RepID=A0A1R2BU33_9CILI|nr:hypothetical protein SteCoe_19524 [Stentor coeruleus]
MHKDFEYYLYPSQTKRLISRLNFKKSRFTASGHEIISDLEKLKSFSQNLPTTNENIESSLIQIPCKRRRSIRNQSPQLPSAETEAISALAFLMLCKNPKKSRKCSYESSQKSEENLPPPKTKIAESSVPAFSLQDSTSYRGSLIKTLSPISSKIFLNQKPKKHIDIAWMTQKLKVPL